MDPQTPLHRGVTLLILNGIMGSYDRVCLITLLITEKKCTWNCQNENRI